MCRLCKQLTKTSGAKCPASEYYYSCAVAQQFAIGTRSTQLRALTTSLTQREALYSVLANKVLYVSVPRRDCTQWQIHVKLASSEEAGTNAYVRHAVCSLSPTVLLAVPCSGSSHGEEVITHWSATNCSCAMLAYLFNNYDNGVVV